MKYLDHRQLDTLKAKDFRTQKPFPWANPQDVLREEAFQYLAKHLLDISMFERRSSYLRKHGQRGHDRWSLEYSTDLDIDQGWLEFIAELQHNAYRQFLRRLYGLRPMNLSFHWHYAQNGDTVSPHCDSKKKIGSHIFYLNTAEDWNPKWGGQTFILNDHGRFSCECAPKFEDFEEAVAAGSMGNRSLIFSRTAHSWHGVPVIDCPADRMRKVFIVVVERVRLMKSLRKRAGRTYRQVAA